MRASVIIPAWNGAAYLPACLDALLEQATSGDEVIVIDNASCDGSADLVAKRYPDVHLLRNEQNLGFAGACNRGIEVARGSFLVFLNQDAVPEPGWLDGLCRAFENELGLTGIVGCKLLFPDGTIQHAGGALSYPLALPAHLGRGEVDRGQWDTPRVVDYVTGAAFAVRRAVVEQVGPLDPAFFPAFYEEVDLCVRARRAGWQVTYLPDAVAVHFETTTIERDGVEYHRWMARGRLRLIIKHYTVQQFRDDFLPAEHAWQGQLASPAMQDGLAAAYADTLEAIPAMRGQGVLASAADVETVAEALKGLQQALQARIAAARQAPQNEDPLAHIPWQLHEHVFDSSVPVIGPVIAGFRRLWNGISTRWYVLSLMQQQNAFNQFIATQLVQTQQELADLRRCISDLGSQSGASGLEVRLEDMDEGLVEVDREVTRLQREIARTNLRLRQVQQTLAGSDEGDA